MKVTKAELEAKFGVPVYTGWHLVPVNLHARNFYKQTHKIVIPDDAKPDGIKGGSTTGGKGFYLLFAEEKWLPESEWTQINPPPIERPKLKVNFER